MIIKDSIGVHGLSKMTVLHFLIHLDENLGIKHFHFIFVILYLIILVYSTMI